MPGGDRTGPFGAGPLTGRGAGYCRGNAVAGYASRFGRGYGRAGRGGYGRGNRYRYFATGVPGWARDARFYDPADDYAPSGPPSTQATRDELAHLTREAEHLKATLADLQTRIDALQRDAKKDEPSS
ncbi:hypothetical protein GF377_08155 [candidate division GN15 bacterium]|nr:hypothetical protein [candidate division GN15 bacterium]